LAKKIQAIRAYGPRLDLERAISVDEYLDLVTYNSGVNRGTVQHVQQASLEALIFLLKQGRPVHTGTAIYTPVIKLDGKLVVHMQVVRQVKDVLNVYQEFKGAIINPENVGKSSDELCDLWDLEHPDDLIER
jgi:hypothetical protein